MSSKGPAVCGTDGTDYMHRQTVASHYQISVINKSRLSNCLILHSLLFILMAVKLMDNILDRMDIFILSLQELYIPKPKLWEYIWTISIIFSILAKKAMMKNSPNLMKIYVAMLISFTFMPTVFAFCTYFADVKNYYITRDLKQVSETWQGLPVALLWYAFLFVAFQLHIAELTFSYALINAWTKKSKSKTKNQ